jgi:aminoglycoside 6-adenylyltransferase
MSRTEKTYEQLIEALTGWAKNRRDIRAAIIIGSRARQDKSIDEWSDLDIMLMARNPRLFLKTTDWLDHIGKHWLTCEIATPTGEQRARIARFEGDAQIDFIIVSSRGIRLAALLLRILARYPSGKRYLPGRLRAQLDAFSETLSQGIRILVDKDGVWSPLLRLQVQRPLPAHPTESEFTNLVNSIWLWSIWTARILKRGELWRAQYNCDHEIKAMLLQMLEWRARAKYGLNHRTWYDGRFLERWAEPDVFMELQNTFAHYDEQDAREALFATVNLFRRVAAETSKLLKYPYQSTTEEHALSVLKRLLMEETESDFTNEGKT